MDSRERRSRLMTEGRYLSTRESWTSEEIWASVTANSMKALPHLPETASEDTSDCSESPVRKQPSPLRIPPIRLNGSSIPNTPSVPDHHQNMTRGLSRLHSAIRQSQEQRHPTMYSGARHKIRSQLGPGSAMACYDYDHQVLPPRPPPRTYRSSFRRSLGRLSLTPGDMLSPPGLLNHADNAVRAEQTLGLRRQSRPPPLPPKGPLVPRRVAGESPGLSRTEVWDRKSQLPLTKVEPTSQDIDPLNGRTAWYHALTAILVVFNCWGLNNSFGLFQAYYSATLLPHSTPCSIAWIGSTQLALVFGLGVPIGRAVDKGFFRPIFHGGSVLMVLGIFITSWCHDWWSLWLVQGLMTGLGMGMVFCSGIVALMTWFDETKMGLAMGLGAAGSCIGGITYVVMARHFLEANGFPTTMRTLGCVAAGTMVAPNLVFRIRGAKAQKTSGKGKRQSQLKKHLRWRTFVETSYLLAAGGMFFAFLGVYFGFVYIISYASDILHLSATRATNLLIYMLAANLPGRFLPALISDKCIGPLNTIIPATLLSSAVIWLWTASTMTSSSLIVIACFYGFVSAGVQVLYAPTVYSFCLDYGVGAGTDGGKANLERMGVKAGGIFTAIGLACLVGTPIGGALISYRVDRQMDQPYLGAQIFAGSSLMLGGLLLLASRVAKAGWQAKRA